jgi:hypothetical protein
MSPTTHRFIAGQPHSAQVCKPSESHNERAIGDCHHLVHDSVAGPAKLNAFLKNVVKADGEAHGTVQAMRSSRMS